eukprot:jgi/Tetstr1/456744/TSEL_043441.t1
MPLPAPITSIAAAENIVSRKRPAAADATSTDAVSSGGRPAKRAASEQTDLSSSNAPTVPAVPRPTPGHPPPEAAPSDTPPPSAEDAPQASTALPLQEPESPQTEGGLQEPQEESETVLPRGASLADGESSPPGSIPVSELPYFPDATPETWQHCSWKATCQLKWLTVDEYTNMPVNEIETPMKYPIAGPDSLEECWPVTKQRWAGQVLIVMPPMPFGHNPEKGSHYPVDEVLEESHRKFKEVVDMLSQGAFVYVSFMSVPCLDLRKPGAGALLGDAPPAALPLRVQQPAQCGCRA